MGGLLEDRFSGRTRARDGGVEMVGGDGYEMGSARKKKDKRIGNCASLTFVDKEESNKSAILYTMERRRKHRSPHFVHYDCIME